MAESVVYNEDCMVGMARYPDKYFDLAIVDPPYGDAGEDSPDGRGLRFHGNATTDKDRWSKYKTKSVERTGGTWASKYGKSIVGWDSAPDKYYFDELRRVSKNQIVFGANYFELPPTRCFIVWRKSQIPLKGFTMAPCEYAWTSFNANASMCEFYSSGGAGRENRFHPTQKPIALYDWLIVNYAKDCKNILDTHVGSGSSRIAASKADLDFTGFEIDKEYWEAQECRFERFLAQGRLF